MPLPCPPLTQLAALTEHIAGVLVPDWLGPAYAQEWQADNPTFGFCAIASEAAFFILGGAPAGWTSWATKDRDGSSHWWLQHADGTRCDPTERQFTSQRRLPPYARGLTGKPCGFMGMRQDDGNAWGFDRRPGRRALVVLEALREALAPETLSDDEAVAALRDRTGRPQFKHWKALVHWSAGVGVTLDLVPRPASAAGEPAGVSIAWIERQLSAPKGQGRAVLEALMAHADVQGLAVELMCLNPGLVPYYAALGFEAHDEPEMEYEAAGDVFMRRAPRVAPATVHRRKAKL